jgi:FAD:protein FMN transferase
LFWGGLKTRPFIVIMKPGKSHCLFSYSITCLITTLAIVGCGKPVLYKETRMLMGTMVSVEIVGDSSESLSGITEKVWAEAARLESVFSRYLPDSEITRINREAGRHPVLVSDEMMEVLSCSEDISRITEGAFDISVGPLMEIWGFFPERKARVPSEEKLADSMARVGWQAIELDRSAGTIHFAKPGMEIDLGALAKGYIVDRLADLLREEGIDNAMVNAGGDIYCLGENLAGRNWRIGLEHPRNEGEILTVLELKNRAIATSGDYRNYFIKSRLRYSHIIDPRTGRPARSKVVEVSVMAPDCMTADGLATSMFVMGSDKGINLLKEMEDVDGVIVTKEEDEIELHFSDERIKPQRRGERGER